MAKSLDWRTVLAPDVVQQIEDEMSRKFAEGWYAYERALQESMREIAPLLRYGITRQLIRAGAPGATPAHGRRAAIGTISLSRC